MGISGGPYIVRDSSLVLELDAADKNSYAGSGTTWSDLSGNNNSGSLISGPTFNSNNGGNIVFNGTSQYIQTPLQNISRPCTFSIWVKVNTLNGWMTFFGQDTSVSIERGRFYFQKANITTADVIKDRVNFSLVNSLGNLITVNAINNIVANVWYNYSAVLTNTSITLYENGIFQNTRNDSNAFLTPNTTILLGAGYFTNIIVDYLNGSIAITQIYNRDLSATEILQNYNELKSRFDL